MTTRGYLEQDCVDLANWIADVLDAPADETVIARVRDAVSAQCKKYPVYADAPPMPAVCRRCVIAGIATVMVAKPRARQPCSIPGFAVSAL